MRSKQPYNTSTVLKADAPCHHSEPTVCESFEVGDICVLIDEDKGKIGKVLKFAYYKEKKKRSRMYQATSVRLNEGKNLGVVCSWFTKSPTQQNEFSAEQADCQHKFTPVSSYSCTLYIGCFEEIESTSHANHTTQNSITRTDRQVIMLQTAKRFTISDNTISVIKSLYASKSSASSVSSSQTLSSLDAEDKHGSSSSNLQVKGTKRTSKCIEADSETRVRYGNIVLLKKDWQHIVLGKQLNDQHVHAYQQLLKEKWVTSMVCKTHFINEKNIAGYVNRSDTTDHSCTRFTLGCS